MPRTLFRLLAILALCAGMFSTDADAACTPAISGNPLNMQTNCDTQGEAAAIAGTWTLAYFDAFCKVRFDNQSNEYANELGEIVHDPGNVNVSRAADCRNAYGYRGRSTLTASYQQDELCSGMPNRNGVIPAAATYTCFNGCAYSVDPDMAVTFQGDIAGPLVPTGGICHAEDDQNDQFPGCSLDAVQLCPQPPTVYGQACIKDETDGSVLCIDVNVDPGNCVIGTTGNAACASGPGGTPPVPPPPSDGNNNEPGDPDVPNDTTPEIQFQYSGGGGAPNDIDGHKDDDEAPPPADPDTCSEYTYGCDTDGDNEPDVPGGTCINPTGCEHQPTGTCNTSDGCDTDGDNEPDVPPGTCMAIAGCDDPDGDDPVPPGTCNNPEGCDGDDDPEDPPETPPGTCVNPAGCGSGPNAGGPGTCTNPNGCDGGITNPGTCMREAGCGPVQPGGCTRPGGCGTDGTCNPSTEQCGDDGLASGGTTCARAPSCSGDQIGCMATYQTWKARCAAEDIKEAFIINAAETAALAALTGVVDDDDDIDPEDAFTDEDEEPAVLDDSGYGYGRDCPAAPVTSFMGISLPITWQPFCDVIGVIRAMVMLMAGLAALQILRGGN